MKYLIIVIMSFLISSNLFGQSMNNAFNKDSLFQVIIKKLPEDQQILIQNEYSKIDEQSKDFFLMMLLMPSSSKKELITNIDTNLDKINILKNEYSKIVPKGYVVYIEFNPADDILMRKENIDIWVQNKVTKEFKQEWNLEYNSKQLTKMIKPLNWTNENLNTIKQLLNNANCISIENGEITTIGYARSGMGKYSLKLFDQDLNNEQIKEFNDGCTYIFYKNNIVLEYGGGAIGSQCFPDK